MTRFVRNLTTLGPISYDARPGAKSRLTYEEIDGDGTVPIESLKGNNAAGFQFWPDAALHRVKANVDHVGITNEKEVWEAVKGTL
jgi:hypothetical protein